METDPGSSVLALIAELAEDRSARSLAAAVGRMVSTAELQPGARLPTVRTIATALGISPTTVSQAWRSLGEAGILVSRGSSGTFVAAAERLAPGRRVYRTYESPGNVALDLSTGIPDPALLPDLGPALTAAQGTFRTASYLDSPVFPRLEEILRGDWPYATEGITIVNGALDALSLLVAELVRMGDPVLVENPGFPPLLDILELAGARVIGVELDDDGPVVDSLRSALGAGPVALFLQPRAQNPTGASMSASRATQVARALRGTDVMVVEDDHASYVCSTPLVSLGQQLPGQTVHIRSFSKTHSPDLRIAAVGGPAALIDRVNQRRLLSSGWTSRMLQAILVHLLTDDWAKKAVAESREVYRLRRQRLVALLDERQVRTTGRDGINLWIEVASEQRALVLLAAAGLGVAKGSPFLVRELAAEHIRLTVGLLDERDSVRVADAVALAAGSSWASNAASGGGRARRAVR